MSTPRCRESDDSSPESGIDLALCAECIFEASRLGLRPGTRQLVEVIVFDWCGGVGEAQPLREKRKDGPVEALSATRGFPVERGPEQPGELPDVRRREVTQEGSSVQSRPFETKRQDPLPT